MAVNVNDRREIWLFSEVERIRKGEHVYRRMKFNIVKYGDDPEEFLEPVNVSDFEDVLGNSGPISAFPSATGGGTGRFTGVRILKGRLCEVHSYDSFDADNTPQSWANGATPTGF